MNLYPSEMSLIGGSNGLVDLIDDDGITIGSEKPIVIIANKEIKFEAPHAATQVSAGELVMAKGNPTTGDIDSSHLMSNSYDTLAQDNTIVEGSNCVEYFFTRNWRIGFCCTYGCSHGCNCCHSNNCN